MPKYEIYFRADFHSLECDSLDDAKKEAFDLVADPRLDLKESKGDTITYDDYLVLDDGDGDDNNDSDDNCYGDDDDNVFNDGDDDDSVKITLIHRTKVPDRCPFCSADN